MGLLMRSGFLQTWPSLSLIYPGSYLGSLPLVSHFVGSQASFLLNLSSWEPSQIY